MTDVFVRRDTETKADREEGHVTIEAEVGVTSRVAGSLWKWREAWNRRFPTAPEGVWPCQHLDFGLMSRTPVPESIPLV